MRTARLVAATFLFGGLFPFAVGAPAACAAPGPHAVLVVDTERLDGQSRYCVALPDASVTGIELVELAHEQHGLQYRLGYGGNVVCQLAGVGYDSDECLKSGPEFWGYWRGDGSGGWDWSSSGGNATTVRDGDVEGWSWGMGNDGSTHPAPPETTFASVCGRPPRTPAEAKPENEGGSQKEKERGSGPPARAAAPPSGAVRSGRAEEGLARERPRDQRRRGRRREQSRPRRNDRPRPLPTATALPAPAVSRSSPPVRPTSAPGGGPPAAGFIASGAVAACIGGALFLQRRRTRLG